MLALLMKILPVLAAASFAGAPALHAQADMGQQMFAVCMACHGPDGNGAPNPAAPGKTMAPPLSGSKLANGDPAVFALIILKGIKKESETYPQVMAPLPLPPPQLAAVMTYVRANFGNSAPAVTEDQVKGYIEKWLGINEPVTRAKLDELEQAAATPPPAAPAANP
jgi:mono/diheme cytochrome c family protein